jgi:hypothetical protein
MKFIIRALFFLALTAFVFILCLGINYIWKISESGFSPKKVHRSLSYHEELDHSPAQMIPLEEIFKQKFYFLGEGAQCFAFESADHSLVVKFFKKKHMRNKKRLSKNLFFPKNTSAKKTSQQKWEKKLYDSCVRYKLALEQLPSETGLLFLHFLNHQKRGIQLTVVSKSKKEYQLDLDDTIFILQRKAELVPDHLNKLLKKKDRIGAVNAILALEELFIDRTKKGLTDPRQCLSINYGFDHGQPLQIDVGRIVQNKQLCSSPKNEILRISNNVKAWVAKHYPEISKEVNEKIDLRISDFKN